MNTLPFSQACENNKAPILAVLQDVFSDRQRVLEIASGTGQHACHLASHMPWLQWQPTELISNLPILHPRCAAYSGENGGENLLAPQELDVRHQPWTQVIPDALFSANSLHIMAWSAVEQLFDELRARAPLDVVLAIYGPFNYGGHYSSDSNARFDQWLAQQHPDSAIRDFEAVDKLAARAGFVLQADNEMPANNRLLVWEKEP